MSRFKKIQIKKRSKNIDLIQVCRLCGIKNDFEQLLPIFIAENEFDDENLDKKILDCVGIVVLQNDNMPPSLCTLCHDKINDFYEYRLMCNATDIQTRILLGLPPQMKPEQIKAKEEEILPIVERAPPPSKSKPSTSAAVKRVTFTANEPLLIDDSDSTTPPPVPMTKRAKMLMMEAERNSIKRLRDDEIKEEAVPEPPKKIKKGDKICKLCFEEFQMQNDLDGHMFIKHVPNIPKYGCATCMLPFFTDVDLKDHQKWHKTTRTPYNCIKCSAKFTNFLQYSKHLTANTCTKQQKFKIINDIACLNCNKKFLTQNLYEWHGCFIKTGKGCAKCGQSFSKKKALFKHYIVCDLPFSDEFLRPPPKLENGGDAAEEVEQKHTIKAEDETLDEALLEVDQSKKSTLPNTITIARPKASKKKKGTSSTETEYNQLSSLLSSVNEAIAKITSVSSKKKKKKKNKDLDIKVEPGLQADETGPARTEDDSQEGSECYGGDNDNWQGADSDEEEERPQLETSLTDSGVAVTVASMKAANIEILPPAVMLQPVVSLGIRVVKQESPDFTSDNEAFEHDDFMADEPDREDTPPLVHEPEEVVESELPEAPEIVIEFDPEIARNIKKEKGQQLQKQQAPPPILITSVRAGPLSSKPVAVKHKSVMAKPKVSKAVAKDAAESSVVQFNPELARNIKKEKGLELASSSSPPKLPAAPKPTEAPSKKVVSKSTTPAVKRFAMPPSLKLKIKKERGILNASLQTSTPQSTGTEESEEPVPEEDTAQPSPPLAAEASEKSQPKKTSKNPAKKVIFKNPAALALKIKKERGEALKKSLPLAKPAPKTSPTKPQKPRMAAEKKQTVTPTFRIKQERMDPGYEHHLNAVPVDAEKPAEDEEEAHEEPEDYLGLNPMSLIVQAAVDPAAPEADEAATGNVEMDQDAPQDENEVDEPIDGDELATEQQLPEAYGDETQSNSTEQLTPVSSPPQPPTMSIVISQVTSGAAAAVITRPSDDLDDISQDTEESLTNDTPQQQPQLQPMVSIPIISNVTSVARRESVEQQNLESLRQTSIPIISNVVSCAPDPIIATNNGSSAGTEQPPNDNRFSENGLDNRLEMASEEVGEPLRKKPKKKIVRNPFAEMFRKKQLEQQKQASDDLVNAALSEAACLAVESPEVNVSVLYPADDSFATDEANYELTSVGETFSHPPPVDTSFTPAFVIKTVETVLSLPPQEPDELEPETMHEDDDLDLETLLNAKIDEVSAGSGGVDGAGAVVADIGIDLEKELLGETNVADPDLANEFLAHLN